MVEPDPAFVASRTAILPLPDGGRILVRPLVPGDRDELARRAAELSPRSRRLRFLQSKHELTDEELDYLTDIDYHDHFAWVARDPDVEGMPGVGIARYVRLPDEPDVAEPAVTVVDDHQRRGIGSLLFGLLAATAVDHGIRRFRGYVLDENLALFDDLDAQVRHDEPGVATVEIDLPLTDDVYPDQATRRVLSAVASGRVTPVLRLPEGVTGR